MKINKYGKTYDIMTTYECINAFSAGGVFVCHVCQSNFPILKSESWKNTQRSVFGFGFVSFFDHFE